MRGARALAVLAVSAAASLAPSCAGSRTPPPPPPELPRAVLPAGAAAGRDPAAELKELLASRPLGDASTRSEVLATTETHSFHLVQTRRAILPHLHRTHVERTTVLAGSGTVVVGGRSYPAVPGASFRIDAGVVHSAYPDEGTVLVALVCYEPPLEVPDDDRVPAPAGTDPASSSAASETSPAGSR